MTSISHRFQPLPLLHCLVKWEPVGFKYLIRFQIYHSQKHAVPADLATPPVDGTEHLPIAPAFTTPFQTYPDPMTTGTNDGDSG